MAAVVRKKYEDIMRECYAEYRRLAEFGHAKLMRCLQEYYLVGRKKSGLDTLNPHANIWSELSVEDANYADNGWQIVAPERLPMSMTIDQLTDWMRERLKREPLWICAD